MNNIVKDDWNLFGSELPPLEDQYLKFSPALKDGGVLILSGALLRWSSRKCSIGLHCDNLLALSINATPGPGTGAEFSPSLQILIVLGSWTSLAASWIRKRHYSIITITINDFPMSTS